jgi:glycerophosphoryl diester phosphodiesterase
MCYTNTREAWETSYKRGVRVIDADLRFTTDGVLVLRHSWNDNIGQDDQTPMMKSSRILDSNGTLYNTIQGIPNNLATFKSTKVYRKLTPMTYLDMLAYLHSHRDLYVSCDIKGENNLKPDYKAVYTYMVNIARKSGYEDVLQNLIIRCYEYEDLDVILSIYPFQNITMYQQTRNPKNWYELCRFCIERGIHAINIPICYIDDPLVQLFVEKGIHVYVAVVDYLSDVEYLSKKGVSGFVTNYLSEQEVKQYCYK